MTLLSMLLAWFPLSVLLLLGASGYALLRQPCWWTALLPLIVLYLYPVAVYRLLNLFWPLREGNFDLSKREYNPWWGGHQIQLIYYACPFLEALLRMVPGLYSAWLRLWGAKVGKKIYWTPNIEIDDRPLLEMGNEVIVGHKVHLIAHVIIPYKGRPRLYVKKIRIGDGCFLGGGSRLGPGVVVEEGVALPVLTDGPINHCFTAEAGSPRRRERSST